MSLAPGRDQLLRCSASGSPAPALSWLRRGAHVAADCSFAPRVVAERSKVVTRWDRGTAETMIDRAQSAKHSARNIVAKPRRSWYLTSLGRWDAGGEGGFFELDLGCVKRVDQIVLGRRHCMLQQYKFNINPHFNTCSFSEKAECNAPSLPRQSQD